MVPGPAKEESGLRLISLPDESSLERAEAVESSGAGGSIDPAAGGSNEDNSDVQLSLDRLHDGELRDFSVSVGDTPAVELKEPEIVVRPSPGRFVYSDSAPAETAQESAFGSIAKASIPLDGNNVTGPSLALDPVIANSDPIFSMRASDEKVGLQSSKDAFGAASESEVTSIVSGDKSSDSQTFSGTIGIQSADPEGTRSVVLDADSQSGDSPFVRTDLQEELLNWRQVTLTGDFNSELTNKLLGQAFASELEKHLALQCVALVAGNVQLLEESWHWRVWRHPEEYGYSLNGKDRFPRNAASTFLKSSLLKLLLSLSPIFVRVYPRKFSIDYLGEKLKTQPRTIEKLRKPTQWDEGFLKSSGIYHFANSLKKSNFALYNIPGLGVEIFYDGNNKSIYFDEIYYKSRPTSHFFHRFLIVMLMIKSGFFVPLRLHPQHDIYGLLVRIKEYLFGSKFAQVTRSLVADNSSVARVLGKTDISFVRSYLEKRGLPSEEQIRDTVYGMQMHIQHRVLAETLDVVGFCESFLDRDFFEDPPGHSEVLNLSPKIKAILEFVTKLNV
jgi:hypothetical protein